MKCPDYTLGDIPTAIDYMILDNPIWRAHIRRMTTSTPQGPLHYWATRIYHDGKQVRVARHSTRELAERALMNYRKTFVELRPWKIVGYAGNGAAS